MIGGTMQSDEDELYLERALRKLLRELGQTQQEVADTLIANGVTGCLGNNEQCPLANYIRDAIENCESAHVTETRVTITIMRGVMVNRYTQATLLFKQSGLEYVGKFVTATDQEMYPELISNVY